MDIFIYLLVGLPLSLLFLYIIFDTVNGDNICPNCGKPFDGHECENCRYTEER